MTISTKILKDLLSDPSVKKAVYYIPERRIFLQATEDVIVGDDAIKTPTVEDYKTLVPKLFRKRIGARSIPFGDQLTLGYHLAKGDLQAFLKENDMEFLYREVEFRAYDVLFKKWIKDNSINIEWSEVEIGE